MRIRLLSLIAGPQGVFQPGVQEIEDVLARALLAGGYAQLLPADPVPAPALTQPEPESAMIEPAAETAVLPPAKARKRP